MVRINLIDPKYLTDQHLRAEYNEILMLFGYVKKYPYLDGSEPKRFTLGKGHIKFFKNKLLYLSKRFDKIKKEMIYRGFNPTKKLSGKYPKILYNDWKPTSRDIMIITFRIYQRIMQKPYYYTYRRWNIFEIDNLY